MTAAALGRSVRADTRCIRDGGLPAVFRGYYHAMTVLIILVVLALLFGVGAVVEGLLWMLLIGIVLVVVAGWYGWTKVRGTT